VEEICRTLLLGDEVRADGVQPERRVAQGMFPGADVPTV
jgi:hypothetical protein